MMGARHRTPPAPTDDDGSEEFALASQLATQVALGLGNAGEGDKYHFRLETVLVASGATARGHGFLFVPADTGIATFVIAGKGTHPMAGRGVPPTEGSFKLSGGGDVDCVLAQATGAQASVDVAYENGMTDEDEGKAALRPATRSKARFIAANTGRDDATGAADAVCAAAPRALACRLVSPGRILVGPDEVVRFVAPRQRFHRQGQRAPRARVRAGRSEPTGLAIHGAG